MDRIETFQDLLDILEAKPEWAQALRQRLLTPELLALPEKFAAFADMVEKRFQALETDMTQVKADVAELKTDMTQVKADVAELKTDMTQVKADVAELKTDMTQVKADVAELKTDMTQVNADVAELKGHAVPVAAQRMTGVIAQAANVRRSRWLNSTQIVDIADDAEDEGRADIPANEMQSFKAIDLAMTAIDKTSGEPCYVVIECSYTLTQDDVARVKRNAAHMARFTGTPAKAVAAGNSIPEAVSIFAEEQDVACVTITSKASSPR